MPNILMQKFPAEEFTATTKLVFKPRLDGERFGFVILGTDYAGLDLLKKADGVYLSYAVCKQADKVNAEIERSIEKLKGPEIYLRVKVTKGASCEFSYSYDNEHFISVKEIFTAKPGRWIGAKMGFFCSRTTKTNDAGFAELDWFRVDK